MTLLDEFAGFLSRWVFRKSLDGYCRLLSTENETTFVSDDGSLASLFELDGFRSLPGPLEISEAVERLRVAFSAYLARPGIPSSSSSRNHLISGMKRLPERYAKQGETPKTLALISRTFWRSVWRCSRCGCRASDVI